MTDYERWRAWAKDYDDDGDDLNMRMKIPLDKVSEDYLKSIDFSDVTAECGAPMTQAQFDAYVAKRGAANVSVLTANQT
jgi:hypothetical protein